MFFSQIITKEYANIYSSKQTFSSVYQYQFDYYKIVHYLISKDCISKYFICTRYYDVMIIHAIIEIDITNSQNIHINYIDSYNYILYLIFVNPALLIFRIYCIYLYKCLNILILEINLCNLSAFSLYYWLGFSIVNRRLNYYLTSKTYIFNTAYTLINNKYLSKNKLRRYLLQ